MNAQAGDTAGDRVEPDEINRLEMRIQCRLSGLVPDFRLGWEGGGWVLRGHARTYYAKQFAQETLMNHSQRPIHANKIEVH